MLHPRRLLVAWLLLAAAAAAGCASNRGVPASMLSWNDPFPAFTIAGNVHYVGTNRMALFLITTPAGHILLDTGFEAKVPQLQDSVESLGFRFRDIKIILSSHAHIDHVQGHARVRQLTGARVLASAADADVIATGGKHEWAYGDDFAWTPSPVDGIIQDGQEVALGGTVLTARLTPGHSRGATTWTTTVRDADGSVLPVLFFPSASVPPGAKVVGNPEYPTAIADYTHSFATWRSLPCQVFLGAHGNFFDLEGKFKRWKAGERPNPFIDHAGFLRTLTEYEAKFRATVKSQT